MTYLQLAFRRPTVLAAEAERAVAAVGTLLQLAAMVGGMLWDRAEFRGARWDWRSRTHLAEHRKAREGSQSWMIVVVYGSVAVAWGAWAFSVILRATA